MTDIVDSRDVAAWFICLAADEGRPLTRMPLQKLVTLAQSMYGYQTLDKLFDESVYAFKYGPVTLGVRQTYGDSGRKPILEPRTKLRSLPDDKMDAVAELWSLCSDVTNKLVNVTHQTGPWGKYHKENTNFTVIPWDEFVDAWPAYENMILSLKKNRHPEIDRTPGNFMLPESEFGKYDRQIMKAQQHAYAAPLSR